MLRLSDAAQAAGVTPAQLQYYLMVGVVSPTQMSAGHQRLFDSRAVQRIAMIRLLNESGYCLRDIREIFLDKNPFGKQGSGQRNLSRDYRKLLKDKIDVKRHSH